MKNGKSEIAHFNFELEEVLEHAKKLKSTDQSIEYLQRILRLKKNNKTIIDNSLDDPDYDFVTEIKSEIKRLKRLDGKKEKRNRKNEADKENTKLTTNDNRIWWKGTEPQIVYLFDLLFNSQLIDRTQFTNRYAIIEKNFKNKFGKPFDNKQLARAALNMSNAKNYGKPKKKDAETIEEVLKEMKEILRNQQ